MKKWLKTHSDKKVKTYRKFYIFFWNLPLIVLVVVHWYSPQKNLISLVSILKVCLSFLWTLKHVYIAFATYNSFICKLCCCILISTGCPKKKLLLSSFEFLTLGVVFTGVKNNSKNFGNQKNIRLFGKILSKWTLLYSKSSNFLEFSRLF